MVPDLSTLHPEQHFLKSDLRRHKEHTINSHLSISQLKESSPCKKKKKKSFFPKHILFNGAHPESEILIRILLKYQGNILLVTNVLPVLFSSVQSLGCVRLFATPWTAAH